VGARNPEVGQASGVGGRGIQRSGERARLAVCGGAESGRRAGMGGCGGAESGRQAGMGGCGGAESRRRAGGGGCAARNLDVGRAGAGAVYVEPLIVSRDVVMDSDKFIRTLI
jgi:hypothetical protein